MPKFAANLSMMFNDVPFPERFARAAKAGFGAVEFLFPYDYPPAEVAGWLKANTLINVLFNTAPGNTAAKEWGVASLPGREADFRAHIATALDYAKALGTPCVHAMAGYLPAGADPAEHRAVFVSNLRYAAQLLAKDGRTLLIEPLNPRDMPGYFLNNQAQAHAIREAVAEPNMKVQMDFYHVQVTEGTSRSSCGNMSSMSAISRSPAPPTATSRMRVNSITAICSACSTKSDTKAGSAASTGRAAAPKTASAGLRS